MATMQEAAGIFDVAARHSYVFDSGLSSPDFFDVEKRITSEEFSLILDRCEKDHHVLEVGCFTGLNLLGLAQSGLKTLYGIDFVKGAIDWLRLEAEKRGFSDKIIAFCNEFDPGSTSNHWNRIVCFDVLEHQLNVGTFLEGIRKCLPDYGKVLFLVPKDKFFYDCGHVAFFPDEECLKNVLEYFFEVEEIFELKSCPKLFACCKRKAQ